jgi:uncharacterized protein (TIGR02466 family)
MSAPPSGPVEKSGVLKLFPTYVWATQLRPAAYGPINRAIVERLEALRPPAARGQWQTSQDLHRDPAFAGLVDIVRQTARGICDSLTLIYDDVAVTGCWANVSERGYPHRPHIHPNNFLSGAYYVRTAPGADAICFHDPRMQAAMIVPPSRDQDRVNSDTVTLDVREGMLVLFPAWLQHSVPPNTSEETRVSVAFNLMFPSFGTEMARPLWRGDTGGG